MDYNRQELQNLSKEIMIILAVFCLLVSSEVFANIEVSRLNISERLEIVLVHGDDEARMNHLQGYEFCKNLTNYLNITSTKQEPYISDLLAVHDHYLIAEKLMPWLLKLTTETFWIGGILKIVPRHHRAERTEVWTDRSLLSFKNFHPHLHMIHEMKMGQKLCIMIAYTSGRWGVEHCRKRMFFACQIVRPNLPIDVPEEERPLDPAKRVPFH